MCAHYEITLNGVSKTFGKKSITQGVSQNKKRLNFRTNRSKWSGIVDVDKFTSYFVLT